MLGSKNNFFYKTKKELKTNQMKQELFTIIAQSLPYLFGAGGFLAYFQERKKRQVELSNKEAGALQEMQRAYDEFVKDSRDIISVLRADLKEVKLELKEQNQELRAVKQDFRDYRKNYKKAS